MIAYHSKFATALRNPLQESKENNDVATYHNFFDSVAVAMNLLSSEEKIFANSSAKNDLLLLVIMCVVTTLYKHSW